MASQSIVQASRRQGSARLRPQDIFLLRSAQLWSGSELSLTSAAWAGVYVSYISTSYILYV
ncbi:hypothetical protein OH77DRAFT_1419178 [Trametes cingulata]|nr:hypothetical protein OH77DRAFT_1419178 [Trametes cingulata]